MKKSRKIAIVIASVFLPVTMAVGSYYHTSAIDLTNTSQQITNESPITRETNSRKYDVDYKNHTVNGIPLTYDNYINKGHKLESHFFDKVYSNSNKDDFFTFNQPAYIMILYNFADSCQFGTGVYDLSNDFEIVDIKPYEGCLIVCNRPNIHKEEKVGIYLVKNGYLYSDSFWFRNTAPSASEYPVQRIEVSGEKEVIANQKISLKAVAYDSKNRIIPKEKLSFRWFKREPRYLEAIPNQNSDVLELTVTPEWNNATIFVKANFIQTVRSQDIQIKVLEDDIGKTFEKRGITYEIIDKPYQNYKKSLKIIAANEKICSLDRLADDNSTGLVAFDDDYNQLPVTEIGREVFSQKTFIGGDPTDIIIPDSVDTISFRAFADITNEITSIQFGNKLREIQNNAFVRLRYEGTLQLPPSLVTIQPQAFFGSDISYIEFLPFSNLQSIEKEAFQNCHNLSRPLKFPSSLRSISNTFSGTKLKNVSSYIHKQCVIKDTNHYSPLELIPQREISYNELVSIIEPIGSIIENAPKPHDFAALAREIKGELDKLPIVRDNDFLYDVRILEDTKVQLMLQYTGSVCFVTNNLVEDRGNHIILKTLFLDKTTKDYYEYSLPSNIKIEPSQLDTIKDNVKNHLDTHRTSLNIPERAAITINTTPNITTGKEVTFDIDINPYLHDGHIVNEAKTIQVKVISTHETANHNTTWLNPESIDIQTLASHPFEDIAPNKIDPAMLLEFVKQNITLFYNYPPNPLESDDIQIEVMSSDNKTGELGIRVHITKILDGGFKKASGPLGGEVILKGLAITEPPFDFHPTIANGMQQAMYSVNNPRDLLMRDMAPESLTNEDFWKQFILDHHDLLFTETPNDLSPEDFAITILNASNDESFVKLQISYLTRQKLPVGNLMVTGFMSRPQLPHYLAADPLYQFQDGNVAPIQNVANLLTNQCYVNGQELRAGWYPFDYVNAFLAEDSSLYNDLQNLVIKNFLYNPTNQFTNDTQIILNLSNKNDDTVAKYYKTGVYPTLNNAITGEEDTGISQLVLETQLTNVMVNGKLQNSHNYKVNLFNAQKINNEAFDTQNLVTDLSTLNKNLLGGDTLDQIRMNELLKQLSTLIDRQQDVPLPRVKMRLHSGAPITKNYSEGKMTIYVDIENIVTNNETKPFGCLFNIPWTITGFKLANDNPLPETSTTTFRSGQVFEFSALSNDHLSKKLLEDVEVSDLQGFLKNSDIKNMFTNLPSNFNNTADTYIIDSIEYDTKQEFLKVYFSLTYAKIYDTNVYNPSGTGVGGYFIVKNFVKPVGFDALNKHIKIATKTDVYSSDPIIAIKDHLLDYLTNTPNCFPMTVKDSLIKILNDEEYFRSLVEVVDQKISVDGINKNDPKQFISINIPYFSQITDTITFSSITGFTFTLTNFTPYQESTITLDQTSFLNYSYEEFVKEVSKGNVGINREVNNLATVTHLPASAPSPVISVSQLHSDNANAKAIVSICFPEFYGPNGLVHDYVYNVVVALAPTALIEPYEPTFNETLNVRQLDRYTGANWARMTAPVATAYLNDPSRHNEITALFNQPRVAALLFKGATPDNFRIEFSDTNVKSRTNDAILITLWTNNTNKQTITLEGFQPVRGETTVRSSIPVGTNVDQLLNEFHDLEGAELDAKAKQFLQLTNAVDNYTVKDVQVMGVESDPQNSQKKKVVMSFLLSDVYIKKDAVAYTIAHDYIFQFQYDVNGTNGGTGTLLAVNGNTINTTYNHHASYSYWIPILVALLVMSIITIMLWIRRRQK